MKYSPSTIHDLKSTSRRMLSKSGKIFRYLSLETCNYIFDSPFSFQLKWAKQYRANSDNSLIGKQVDQNELRCKIDAQNFEGEILDNYYLSCWSSPQNETREEFILNTFLGNYDEGIRQSPETATIFVESTVKQVHRLIHNNNTQLPIQTSINLVEATGWGLSHGFCNYYDDSRYYMEFDEFSKHISFIKQFEYRFCLKPHLSSQRDELGKQHPKILLKNIAPSSYINRVYINPLYQLPSSIVDKIEGFNIPMIHMDCREHLI